MADRRKYAAGCNWDDVASFCRELLTEHDLLVYLTMERIGLHSMLMAIEVKLYEGVNSHHGLAPLAVQRAEMKLRGDGQASQAMLAVQQAYSLYQGDPWNWTLRDRRREAALEG